ncbi:MAG: ribosome maturation factor RimP [Oscillospiraceae bacterium]|nr:ribosome maturation factor RimP [Oscillospiraceae bacterium]
MSKITDKISALAAPVAEAQGVSIWDIEYVKEAVGMVLRVYIDKEEGIDINDCEAFSRTLDPLLDEADPISESYTFEVSSAGLERELRKESHFAFALGKEVEAKLYKPREGSKLYRGILKNYENGAVTLESAGADVHFEKEELAALRVILG